MSEVRVEIDPNVRVGGNMTYTRVRNDREPGFNQLPLGTTVTAFESEAEMEWPAVIVERHLDSFTYLAVHWGWGRYYGTDSDD